MNKHLLDLDYDSKPKSTLAFEVVEKFGKAFFPQKCDGYGFWKE